MIKLDFEPYNTNRIDCYWNNVVGLLTSRHEEFEALVSLVASQYAIAVPRRDAITEEAYRELQYNGWLLPYVTRELPDELCDRYVERTELTLGQETDIVDLVKRHVRSGQYCVIRLNRFHFPYCPESMHRHMVHPVLVYGYDDARSVVFTAEDCVPPGKITPYELSYERLQNAYDSVAEEDRYGLSLRVLQDRMSTSVPIGVIRANIHKQLYGTSVETERETLLRGLDAVTYYREQFAEIALAMSGQDLGVNLRLSYPLYYQQRNLMLIDYLDRKRVLGGRLIDELRGGFTELYQAWGLIRTKLIQYYVKPDRPTAADYAAEMEPYLDRCLLERELLQRLLESLERADMEAS